MITIVRIILCYFLCFLSTALFADAVSPAALSGTNITQNDSKLIPYFNQQLLAQGIKFKLTKQGLEITIPEKNITDYYNELKSSFEKNKQRTFDSIPPEKLYVRLRLFHETRNILKDILASNYTISDKLPVKVIIIPVADASPQFCYTFLYDSTIITSKYVNFTPEYVFMNLPSFNYSDWCKNYFKGFLNSPFQGKTI